VKYPEVLAGVIGVVSGSVTKEAQQPMGLAGKIKLSRILEINVCPF
jgi:hypothetical protein